MFGIMRVYNFKVCYYVVLKINFLFCYLCCYLCEKNKGGSCIEVRDVRVGGISLMKNKYKDFESM